MHVMLSYLVLWKLPLNSYGRHILAGRYYGDMKWRQAPSCIHMAVHKICSWYHFVPATWCMNTNQLNFTQQLVPTTELVLQKWACHAQKTIPAQSHHTYPLVRWPSGFKVTTVLTLVLHLSDFSSLISSSFSRSCSLAWFSSFSIVAKSYIKIRCQFSKFSGTWNL